MRWTAAATLALLAGAIWAALTAEPAEAPVRATPAPTPDLSGYARALAPRAFRFPDDHGPHPEFQTEWWYYTGHLEAEDGRPFAFQLTFFRRALTPQPAARASALAADQIYFAHFALTDVAGGAHTFAERFSRGAGGLAGASGRPFQVWLEDWRAEALDAEGSVVRLRAAEGELSIDLTLEALKPVVAHGDRGLSAKSEASGNASYYLSFTHLRTRGEITLAGQRLAVAGESWFDHEWSTSALGPQAVGWDWFSLQLSDGRELMVYQIRRADGSLESVSQGTLVEPDGATVRLALEDVRIDVLESWTSAESGAVYPARWRVRVERADIDLMLEPVLADQEMRLSLTYWEGAVRLRGTSAGRAVEGRGFVELTGYAESMQGVF